MRTNNPPHIMNIHQKMSHRHKRQLTNMESCRNNRLYYVYITVIILILDLSATAKRPSVSKYDTYQIHEAMVDSTMYDMLLHKAIPALEKHADDSFCWMFFQPNLLMRVILLRIWSESSGLLNAKILKILPCITEYQGFFAK